METERPRGNTSFWTTIHIFRLIGLALIVSAACITLFVRCTTKGQNFAIYTFVGAGIAMLLVKSADKTKLDLKLANNTISLVGAVALPFILFFTDPIGAFKPDQCNLPINVTVFVHGKKGPQDVILSQNGFVVMHVKGGEVKNQPIGENGQAYFQNLVVGDSIRLSIKFSEPYKTISPDAVYTVPANGIIYLPITLEGIDQINGVVRDFLTEELLEGVVATLGDVTDTSDAKGWFSLSIPESLQRKEQEVYFFKKGYQTVSQLAFPQTRIPMKVMMTPK